MIFHRKLFLAFIVTLLWMAFLVLQTGFVKPPTLLRCFLWNRWLGLRCVPKPQSWVNWIWRLPWNSGLVSPPDLTWHSLIAQGTLVNASCRWMSVITHIWGTYASYGAAWTGWLSTVTPWDPAQPSHLEEPGAQLTNMFMPEKQRDLAERAQALGWCWPALQRISGWDTAFPKPLNTW